MSRSEKTVVAFLVALAVGAVAQMVARQQAAILGLSAFEIAVAGAIVGAVTTRALEQ